MDGSSPGSRRRTAGFTAVELLVAAAVLSTLLAIATPSWRAASKAMHLTALANSFASHLNLARSEAIKRNARIVLCKSADQSSCAAADGWEQGWIVFHDANNNAARDTGEHVIEGVQALPSGYRLTGNSLVSSYLSFTPEGAAATTSGAFQVGTLTLCKSGEAGAAREIALNLLGRPKIRKATLTGC